MLPDDRDGAAPRWRLHRERARLLRDVIRDLEAAHAALAEARRLLPDHPLLTTDMLDIADQLRPRRAAAADAGGLGDPAGRAPVGGAARRCARARRPRRRGDRARAQVRRDLVGGGVRAGGAGGRGRGRASAALSAVALLALASRIALHAEAGDAIGLCDAFEAEGEQGQGEAAAHAFVRAATLRDLVLHDARHAESLYRKALERCPGYPPAVDALEEMLRADGRWADLAEVLEQDLAALGPPPEDGRCPSATDAPGGAASPSPLARRRYLLEALVGLYRDRLGPARAARWSSSASAWRSTPGISTGGCSRATSSSRRRSPARPSPAMATAIPVRCAAKASRR